MRLAKASAEGTTVGDPLKDGIKVGPLVSRAQSVVDYVLDVMTAGHDVADPKAKAEVARTLLPLILPLAVAEPLATLKFLAPPLPSEKVATDPPHCAVPAPDLRRVPAPLKVVEP